MKDHIKDYAKSSQKTHCWNYNANWVQIYPPTNVIFMIDYQSQDIPIVSNYFPNITTELNSNAVVLEMKSSISQSCFFVSMCRPMIPIQFMFQSLILYMFYLFHYISNSSFLIVTRLATEINKWQHSNSNIA